MSFKVGFTSRWADFDPNNHMRHSAYNDYAAEARVRMFNEYGLSLIEFNKLNVGPVLFREETNFRKEIRLSEDISVEVFLKGMSENGERFKFFHKIFKQDGRLAAEVEIYGAWLDLKERKLTDPPSIILNTLKDIERTADFEIIPLKKDRP
jgi:acyl-CoA thioester hydrolase